MLPLSLKRRIRVATVHFPLKDNAIYRLAAGLTRLADYDFPVRLNETTGKLFERRVLLWKPDRLKRTCWPSLKIRLMLRQQAALAESSAILQCHDAHNLCCNHAECRACRECLAPKCTCHHQLQDAS